MQDSARQGYIDCFLSSLFGRFHTDFVCHAVMSWAFHDLFMMLIYYGFCFSLERSRHGNRLDVFLRLLAGKEDHLLWY